VARRRITQLDLEDTVGASNVSTYFDDDSDGVAETPLVERFLERATAYAEGILGHAWSAAPAGPLDTLDEDPRFIDALCWIALALAAKRRPQWMLPDGSFPFAGEMKRVTGDLKTIAAGLDHFAAEQDTTRNPQTTGSAGRALPPSPVFATSRSNPSGSGGF
jgi:hypothetical protein